MQLHSLFLFLHVTSAMGLFAALGMEGLGLLQLRRAAGARDIVTVLDGFRLVERVGGLSLATAVLSGAYLASTAWHWRGAWISVAFASLVVIAVIGATMSGRRIARLRVTTTGGDASESHARSRQRDPILAASFLMRASILLGIVFLMTVKPELGTSLGAMAVVVVIGCLASFVAFRRQTQDAPGRGREAAGGTAR